MTTKENIMNNILIAMQPHINQIQQQILEKIIKKELFSVEITRMETLPSTEMDNNEYLVELFKVKKGRKLSPKTIDYYLRSIRNLYIYIGKNLIKMTDMDVDMYLDYYESKGNCAVTVNNERRNISAFYSWMRKIGFIVHNPVENVDLRTEIQKPIDYLTNQEMEQLREGCSTVRNRAMFEYLRSTACRVGEIPKVKIKDVDWNKGELLIYAPKQKRYRTIFIDETARYYIRKYLVSRKDTRYELFKSMNMDGKINIDKPLFPIRCNPIKPISEDGIREMIYGIAKRAGLTRRVYPHLFRKTMGMKLRKNNCPESVIMGILGDTSADVVRKHYSANSVDQLRQAHEQYGMG